jgi:hypothetical protein
MDVQMVQHIRIIAFMKRGEPSWSLKSSTSPTIPGEVTIQEEIIKSFFQCIVVENTIVVIQVHILTSSNIPRT